MEESRRKEAANAGKLVILTGPTAVGKTALSVALAKKIGGEIISADSMQVYRGMDIGSAKVTVEEMSCRALPGVCEALYPGDPGARTYTDSGRWYRILYSVGSV